MSDRKNKLNKEQAQAVTHGDGPLLIIAGAGTGKTTVVTERMKYLMLEKNVSANNILALTFSEKAAKEMQDRIDIALPYGYADMWISTFHAFCDRILRDEGIHIGLNPGYTLASDTQLVLFLKRNLSKLDLQYFRPLGNPNKFILGLLQHFSRLKDEDISSEEYLMYAKKRMEQKDQTPEQIEESEKILELANAFAIFEKLKIQSDLLDFGDLISYTLKLFKTRKHVLKSYQDKFSYMLIDEFQDTNYAQNKLAILLSGNKRNITVVADDDQAIYRWRGAAVSNIIYFRSDFPDAKIVTLNKNYRSTQKILDTSYKLIQFNNPDRLEVQEHINKKLQAVRRISGNEVTLISGNDAEEETDQITDTIQTLVTSGTYTYKDIAILVRANDHAGAFIKAFDYKNIPYQFLGPGQLFHQEVIKDLIAYLKVLYNFEDSASLYRLLTMNIFHIPATDIAILLNESKKRNIPLFETFSVVSEMKVSDKAKEKIAEIAQMLQAHFELISQKKRAGDILYAFLEESGLLKKYSQTVNRDEQLEIENIAKFFDRLKAFETSSENASIFAVVDWIDIAMQLGDSPLAASDDWSENNAVNILTIHSSKGLEFPVVFVVNLVTQRFPSRERHELIPIPLELVKEVLPVGDHHLQEERRLCYVAMTRAKDLLFLTAARFYGEGKRERKLSPFVLESLPEKSILKHTTLHTQKKQHSLIDSLQTPTVKTSLPEDLQKPSITYLSYSQMQTFDVCPLHYNLKYILNVPTPPTAAQSFGTSVHAVLKEFYQLAQTGGDTNLKILPSLLKKHWIYEGYESKTFEKEARERALVTIERYLQANFRKDNRPLALEFPFQFSAKYPLKIGGRIDRIDKLSENKLEIIDYKTGDNIPDKKELDKNLQLSMYALALTHASDMRLKRKAEDIVLSFHYLEKDIKLSTSRSTEQLVQVEEEIIKKAEEIRMSDFACSKSLFCQNCEYKMLCNNKLI